MHLSSRRRIMTRATVLILACLAACDDRPVCKAGVHRVNGLGESAYCGVATDVRVEKIGDATYAVCSCPREADGGGR